MHGDKGGSWILELVPKGVFRHGAINPGSGLCLIEDGRLKDEDSN